MTRVSSRAALAGGRLSSQGAIGAIVAQVTQAGASLALQLIAAMVLGLAGFGKFAILYGTIVLLTGLVSGFVGDSLTVLDRGDRAIRAALQGWTLILSCATAFLGAFAVTITGFVTTLEGALFGLAALAFLLEDVLRRLLMAQLKFWRISVVDGTALLVSVAVLALVRAAQPLTLPTLFAALGAGQFAAICVAVVLQPREERYLVRFMGGGYRAVAGYGTWRSAQQAVRPGLLTAIRTTVMLMVGLAATGQLEAARLFAAPTMLLVGGFSTFLFASFARNADVPLKSLLARADRGVLTLLAVTILVGGLSLFALPSAGQLVIGRPLDLLMVIGWLGYSASVAAVTPYGALAAVRGRQATVLGWRVADSVLSLVAAAILLALGGQVALVPFVLLGGSLAGGFAIRWLVLRPYLAFEQRATPASVHVREQQATAHA